ncbi:uncharacterized protein TNCV_2818971 [Trichonephila clavipes]|nr:uncharacterized protein TNCV_2818971 [Trichonephila clavipes]
MEDLGKRIQPRVVLQRVHGVASCFTPRSYGRNSLSSRKISTSSRGSVSDQDISETSVFGSLNPEDSPNYDQIGNTSYPMESYNHSDQSSPSESPYGSNVSLHNAGQGKGNFSGLFLLIILFPL